jgi:hypothetical protein
MCLLEPLAFVRLAQQSGDLYEPGVAQQFPQGCRVTTDRRA